MSSFPVISFIVPAHNEEIFLPRTLQAIHTSARSLGLSYEIIVVNDASTDHTSDVACHNAARVLDVHHRKIAATRNSGARAARGERFVFVDADTTINPRVLSLAIRHLDKGAAGGGALCRFDRPVPLYAHLLLWWFALFMRPLGIAGGAFMFCTRHAFDAVGGFDENLYAAEDAAMSWALKRHGRFVVLWPTVRTSGRRVREKNGFQILSILVRMAFVPKLLREHSKVKKIWYESNRSPQQNHSLVTMLGTKIINAIALLLMIAVITSGIWILPWPETLLPGPIRAIRFVTGVVGLHVGLLLWPCLYFLLRLILRQKRPFEILKLALVIALCATFAWRNTGQLFQFWFAS